jgi:cytochrome c
MTNRSASSYVTLFFAITLVTMAALIWFFILREGGAERLRKVDSAIALTSGNPRTGQKLISTVGCGACHEIPGIAAAHGQIGPSLANFQKQAMIAGVMSNSAPNLIRWLQDPRAVDSQTAMPQLGLTEEQARDIAAFLYGPKDP